MRKTLVLLAFVAALSMPVKAGETPLPGGTPCTSNCTGSPATISEDGNSWAVFLYDVLTVLL